MERNAHTCNEGQKASCFSWRGEKGFKAVFIAINQATNQRCYIDDVVLNRENGEDKGSYRCPICEGEVIVRNGQIVAPHFAHKAGTLCDTFSQDMSQWHKDWQDVFPKQNQEYVMTLETTEEEYNISGHQCGFLKYDYGEFRLYNESILAKNTHPKIIKHRADVCACGYIIEFQHSPISSAEFNERNWFYTSCGYKVVWIFDVIEKRRDKTMCDYEATEYGWKYKWKYPIKTFNDFVPQYYKKRRNEDGEWEDSSVLLFFQMCDNDNEELTEEERDGIGIIEQVIWAVEDKDGYADFRRFSNSCRNCFSGKEFREAIIHRKL